MALELFAIGLVLATAGLLWLERRLDRHISAQAAQLERTAALKADLRWWQASARRLAEWQDVTESSIDGGTQAVRAIHRGIAAIPFEILESIPATRHTSRAVREIHDFTADNVYAAVSAVNRLVGSGSRRVIDRSRGAPAARPDVATAEPARSPADDPGRNDH